MTKRRVIKLGFGAGLLMSCGVAFSAGGDTAAPAAPPPAAPAAPLPGALPPLPGAPEAAPGGVPSLPVPDPFGAPPGGLPGMPTDPNAAPGTASSAIPLPPPLTITGATLSGEASATQSTDTVAASGPIETYQFLFREDTELGIVREKYAYDQAEQLKQQEIDRLYAKYQQPNQPQPVAQPGQPAQADPKAGAAWDFYYEQLEMYDKYVKEKLLIGAEELPALSYDANNAAQEWLDIAKSFNEAAVQVVNDQYNENREFYDRLQSREDRRRDFYEWLAANQHAVEEWTGLWARKINGGRWADGEPVRRDDWYYGVDFNSAAPVSVRIDQQDYLLSREPQRNVPREQLNVLSQNLTPYDIIDATGQMKNPDMERLRGTLVVPPTTVAAVSEFTTGTVQLVP